MKCSSGTYVRALAHDLGLRLGCGAHLAELVRIEIGDYRLDDALSLEEIQRLFESGRLNEFLQPLETFLPALPKIFLAESGRLLILAGRTIFPENLAETPALGTLFPGPAAGGEPVFRLFSQDGRLVALAKRGRAPSSFSPILVLT